MTKNRNQSRSHDSVSEEQACPERAIFHGRLEETQPHRVSQSEQLKIAALSQALHYGKPGRDWVLKVATTETGPVQWAAYDLLWKRENAQFKQELLKYLPLRSEVGADYTRLRDLLAAGQWEEADEETERVMLKVAHREKEGLLDRKSIENFPSQDLRTIDRLWVCYSYGRFGFSVQKRIWESIVGNQQANRSTPGQHRLGTHLEEHLDQLGDRVGWRVQGHWLYFSDLTFNISAPKGHLPSPRIATPCDVEHGGEQACKQTVGRWCVMFCFGGVRCGVLFLGWWSLLLRKDL